jgi:hypothetical protein
VRRYLKNAPHKYIIDPLGPSTKRKPLFRGFLNFGLFVLVTRLSEELEHVLLVDFDPGLVEGVNVI